MKKLTTKILVTIATATLITGCATQTPEPEAASAPAVSAEMLSFNTAWNAADSKRKDAAKIGAEWRDTGKMLKNAKAEAEAGNMDKAMKLVAKAQEQSRDAILQHARESSVWQSRVPGASS